ncbi:hypothetical protein BKA56DRAFT_637566 [Ilyonectria sp. MPI-CAGE-AT-0026]|nr:hypothetical protein BKA56DRAFT_637566 [Ilyonectria sp. MPI-CAGE-AT-0026]
MTAASVLERARHSLEGYWESLTSDKKTQYLLICLVYLLIFAYHTRRSLPQGSFSLVLHILAGSFELGNVVPELLDTVACFVQAFTTLRLTKTLLRGEYNDTTVLPGSRIDAALHRTGCHRLPERHYTPGISQASPRLPLHSNDHILGQEVGVGKIHSNATIYAHAVFLGAIIAIHDSGLPAGVPVYIGMVGAVMVLNRYVADRLARTLMCVLLWLGLANLEADQEHDRSSKPPPSVNDEYVQEGM